MGMGDKHDSLQYVARSRLHHLSANLRPYWASGAFDPSLRVKGSLVSQTRRSRSERQAPIVIIDRASIRHSVQPSLNLGRKGGCPDLRLANRQR